MFIQRQLRDWVTWNWQTQDPEASACYRQCPFKMGCHQRIEIRSMESLAIRRGQRHGVFVPTQSKRSLAQGGYQAQVKAGPRLLPLQFGLSTLGIMLDCDPAAQRKLLARQKLSLPRLPGGGF